MKFPQRLDIKYLLLVILTTLFSCQKEDPRSKLLVQAQNVVEANPEEALAILNSIQFPQSMDKDYHMQYLVVHVQAKYKLYQDITQDTIIFEAQKYFEKKGDPEQIVLADFYTNAVYVERKALDKSLEYLLRAKQFLPRIDNKLLIGRVYHNIGDAYYERDIMDSAIVYYQKALQYHRKEKNTDISRMYTLHRASIAFKINNELDSTYACIKEGLDLAKETKNNEQETRFTYLLANLYLKKEDFDKAEPLYMKALEINTSTKIGESIDLNLAIFYTAKKQPHLAKPYIELIEKRLPKVTDNYVQRSIVGTLHNYYELIENPKQAIYFLNRYMEITQTIDEINSTQRLLDVSNLHNASLKEKEIEKLQIRNRLYQVCGASAILILLIIGYFTYKNIRHRNRRNAERSKRLKSENELLRQKIESFSFLQSIHQDILGQWKKINKEVESLARQYGAKEKPELYVQIKKLIDDLKSKTNNQLIEWAKGYVKEQPLGEKYLKELDDKNILLLALCYNKYTNKQIRLIISASSNNDVQLRRFDLKYKLKNADILTPEIDELLFAENN